MTHDANQYPKIGDKMPDGTVYAGLSPYTGKILFTAVEDASLKMTWDEAVTYTTKLNAHGHKDWRLPDLDELKVVMDRLRRRTPASTFRENAWYWSATVAAANAAWLNGSGGIPPCWHYKSTPAFVRAVRSGRSQTI